MARVREETSGVQPRVQDSSTASGPSSSPAKILASARPALYKSLNPETRQIRLLAISYFDRHEPYLEGSLVVVSLNDNPVYVALSYEWNPPSLGNDALIPAKIDGHLLSLSVNLFHGLLFITNGASSPKFWVDALCINQDDKQERSQQIVLMTEIFGTSSLVCAWLGREGDDSDLAMDLLSQFEDFFELQMDFRPRTSIHNSVYQWFLEKVADLSLAKHWEAMCQLCERSYWTRRWIVQELVVARKSKIFCESWSVSGVSLLTLSLFAQTCMSMGDHPIYGVAWKFRNASQSIGWIAHAWQKYPILNDRMELLRCLHIFSTANTYDPRDKVYSLLGIAKPSNGLKLLADYDAAVDEVFIATAKHIITTSEQLDILLCCSMYDTKLLGLPSWVPNWTNHPVDPFPRREATIVTAERLGSMGVSFSSGDRMLQTKAVLIGKVDDQIRGKYLQIIPGEEQHYEAQALALVRKWARFALKYQQLLLQDEVSERSSLQKFLNVLYTIYEECVPSLAGGLSSTALLPFGNWLDWVVSPSEQVEGPCLSPDQMPLLALQLSERICLFKYSSLETSACQRVYQGFGIGDWRAIAGDVIAVVPGCQAPLLLRLNVEMTQYQIIGRARIDGITCGEALEFLQHVDICIC